MWGERQRAKSGAFTPHPPFRYEFCLRARGYLGGVVRLAFRGASHAAAWFVWQSMKISLLDDLDAPRPPAEDLGARAASAA